MKRTLTGTWALRMRGPQGLVNMTLKLVQSGEEVRGTIDGPMGLLDLRGAVDGSEFRFNVEVQTPTGAFDMVFTGVVEDADRLVGSMAASGAEVISPFTATRVEMS